MEEERPLCTDQCKYYQNIPTISSLPFCDSPYKQDITYSAPSGRLCISRDGPILNSQTLTDSLETCFEDFKKYRDSKINKKPQEE